MSEVSSFNELEINEGVVLGTGYISKVKLARSRVNSKLYAVKIVRLPD